MIDVGAVMLTHAEWLQIHQTIQVGKARANAQPRDWVEDFADENGQYMCLCHECKRSFIGYKRRVVCKLCTK